MTKVKLNSTITIDLEKLIESRLLIQANSGGGKSWAIRRLIEQSFGKVQIIVIDPEGEFGNLRSKFDFVYAGKDGDAPVESRSAALLAHRLLELKASAIIDLYELPPQERKLFVRLFCESMVNAPKELWHDTLIIIDEAHVFAPEKGESEAMGPVIDLATRGRKRGYCTILATQRLPKLNKDASAECNNKLIGRASQDIDRKRASEELGFTTREQILSLRDLDPGEFYVFGPAISREVIRCTIGDVQVKPAKRGVSRQTLSAPSATVKKILAKLADLPQEAAKEAKTVTELQIALKDAKRQIVQLERPGSSTKNADEAFHIAEMNKLSYERQLKDMRGKIYEALLKIHGRILIPVNELLDLAASEELHLLKGTKTTYNDVIPYVPRLSKKSEGEFYGKSIATLARESVLKSGETKLLSKGARSVLSYLDQVFPQSKTKTQLWVATGYAPGGGFNNIIYELSGMGAIDKEGNQYRTVSNHSLKDQLDIPFNASLDKWDNKLSKGARMIFHLMLSRDTEIFGKEYLAQQTGYSQGGGFNNLIYELTGKELISKIGTNYKINPEIMDL